MYLKQLLSNPIFSKSVLLTGKLGLDRLVDSVNLMDAPDIIHYVKPGQLLLSNGYFMKKEPALMMDLIQQMDKLGCSGLAVKTKRFKLDIPKSVLEKAESLSFPIIELSSVNHSLGEILEQSTGYLLENKNHELQYAISINKQFSSMTLQGKGMALIIETLAGILSAPVILLSHRLQIVEESEHFQDGMIRSLLNNILSALQVPFSNKEPDTLGLVHSLATDYRYMTVFPIHTYRNEGYIIQLNRDWKMDKLLMIAIEQAAHVIGMEFSKNQAVKERSRRYKNEFFSDLIDGFISDQEALHRGKKYGLDASRSMLLCIAKEDEISNYLKQPSLSFDETAISLRDKKYELIKRRISLLGIPFTMFTKSDQFISLFYVEELKWDEIVFVRKLEELSNFLYNNEGMSFSFGAGNLFTHILDIRFSYEEAAKALTYGQQMGKPRFVHTYQSNDVGYLFRMLPVEELKHFYEDTFKGFLTLNENEREELLKTLHVYYKNHCHLLDTAKELYIHRNTVIYRLEKCEKITGVPLKESMQSLRFQLAFAIKPLLFSKK
ncbi:hypothetical protein BK126_16355 [Paenibacillus sp. FSL H7-0326]|uniref:PucR family transcriptional regulator n=1 Tax=Paenibacillus sp. FSL H7-0326 TaxID=1921144 RepID=UPI00096F2A43|nr:hypothetical protein BK126_16355 [Paenibacillus sp. FSL H7-0326]